jgi:hypothetical protein
MTETAITNATEQAAGLLEKILAAENLNQAYKQVESSTPGWAVLTYPSDCSGYTLGLYFDSQLAESETYTLASER